MKILLRDQNGNVKEFFPVRPGFIPDGHEIVADEDVPAEELLIAKRDKMGEIRFKRDSLLVENDKLWLIASKTGQSVTAIESDAQALRDLPESAQTAIDAMDTIEEVKAYDPFEE